MTRGKQCRSTALCACLAALALFAPASANADGPAALEEYVLTLPGVDTKYTQDFSALVERAERAGPIGVVGEQDDSFTRLAGISAAAATPAGVGVVLLLAGGVALGARRRGKRV